MEKIINPLIATNIKRIDTKRLLVVLSFILVLFSVIPSVARAASIYISPSSGTYTIGQSFTASVFVSSTNQSMNAVSGVITFPYDKLDVVSISKTGSIINMWAQEPSFINGSTANINFEGIVFNPGFTGTAGKIINITFKAKSVGIAPINFSSASILANDGQGTNILTNISNANYVLEGFTETPIAARTETLAKTIGTPNAPEIFSLTHTDPNKWYQLKTVKLSWKIGGDIISDSAVIDKNPRTTPQIVYTPPITSKEASNLSEGVWYLHVQLKNDYGWGDITHFRIQIDTTPPEPFTISVNNQGDKTNPQPLLIFRASDKLSGIDYYEIKLGNIYTLKIPQNEINGSYKTPIMPPGEHSIIIRAFDKAGNYTPAVETITIMPIETPVIQDYPTQLSPGSPLTLRGKSLPKSKITVFILNERKELISENVLSGENGVWHFILGKTLDRGVYTIYATTTDSRGAQSNASESIKLIVNIPIFARIGNVVITYLNVIITLLSLLLLMIMVWMYGLRRIRYLKKIIKKETQEAESSLYKAFNILREETSKQVANFDGKPELSRKEQILHDELKSALNNAEKIISKEIKDIKKEVKN